MRTSSCLAPCFPIGPGWQEEEKKDAAAEAVVRSTDEWTVHMPRTGAGVSVLTASGRGKGEGVLRPNAAASVVALQKNRQGTSEDNSQLTVTLPLSLASALPLEV